jgi:hypothetical protein
MRVGKMHRFNVKTNGFQFPTAVDMKSFVFWDTMPCSTLKANRRFGGTCRLHLQCRRISRAGKEHETAKS